MADYGDRARLAEVLEGADAVLFISGSEVGRRLSQHRNVVEEHDARGKGLRARSPLAGLAAEITRLSGTEVEYRDMPRSDYEAALVGFGLPARAAGVYADADRAIAAGELPITTGDLARLIARLIGRPTTPPADVLAEALKTL